MGYNLLAASCLLVVLANSYQSFVDTAPLEISNGNNRSIDEPVEELESLKQALGNLPKQLQPAKEISISKIKTSLFSDVNGRRTGLKETQQQVNKDGAVLAKLVAKTELNQEKDKPAKAHTLTEIDVPSEGIHRTFHKEAEGENAEQDSMVSDLEPVIDKINALSGFDYSPLDMAEYVFWTGDEKGVTLAIEDFLEEGLMTRDEAINFLQSIKNNLDYIQAHYQGLRKMEEKIANKLQDQIGLGNENSPYEDKVRASILAAVKSKSNPYGRKFMKALEHQQILKQQEEMDEKPKRSQRVVEGEDYEEMMDRLKGADFLNNDYTLEEVIYELAKVMFSQSLAQGSKQAHNALRRFTDYLEKEVAYGQISRDLEKKILAVLVAALSDTLGERPELLPAASEGLSNIENQKTSESRTHQLNRRSQSKLDGKLGLLVLNGISSQVDKSAIHLRQDRKVTKN